MDLSHINGTALSGKLLSATIRNEIKEAVATLKSESNVSPSVAVVLVGSRPDSATYVRMKQRACEEVGIAFTLVEFAEDVTQDTLSEKLAELNGDSSIHGILVQLPLPKHIDEKALLLQIDPAKDVDGSHPIHMGSLAMRSHEPLFIPCTPKGCMELLKRSGISVEGKKAVVVGRSNLVGIPMSLLLTNANATVTLCHSRTQNLADEITADFVIVVAAVGKATFIKGDWIKPGAVCLDVGINAVDDATRKRGYRLVGDIDYAEAKEVASLITPVPGGVGPMTVAMLLQNTLESAQRSAKNPGKPCEPHQKDPFTAAYVVGPRTIDTTRWFPLHQAALVGQHDVFEELVAHNFPINERDDMGWTALHWAATGQSIEAITELIRLGADPNIKASDQLLPIHQAAQNQNVDVMKALLDAGTDIWQDGGLDELEELSNQYQNMEMQYWVKSIRTSRNKGGAASSSTVFGLDKEKTLKEKERLALLRLQEKKEREARTKAGITKPIASALEAETKSSIDFSAPDQWQGPKVTPLSRYQALSNKDPNVWSIDDVSLWFSELNLSENYMPVLRENRLIGKRLMRIHTAEDWKKLGVWKYGDVRKLLKATCQPPFDKPPYRT